MGNCCCPEADDAPTTGATFQGQVRLSAREESSRVLFCHRFVLICFSLGRDIVWDLPMRQDILQQLLREHRQWPEMTLFQSLSMTPICPRRTEQGFELIVLQRQKRG
jgi:hypothetical protein